MRPNRSAEFHKHEPPSSNQVQLNKNAESPFVCSTIGA
jgi:hypothetical protein